MANINYKISFEENPKLFTIMVNDSHVHQFTCIIIKIVVYWIVCTHGEDCPDRECTHDITHKRK